MKLRIRLFLATSLTVLAILGISESVSYRQTAVFLRAHEAQMARDGAHSIPMATFRERREAFLSRLALLSFIHAGLTVLALLAVLTVLWSRIVLRPIGELLQHIAHMGHGVWTSPLPVRRKDEIGELTEAFNKLGDQLSLTVEQSAATSKLSAMALLGQSLLRRIVQAKEHLQATATLLRSARASQKPVPPQVLVSLDALVIVLEEIPDQFEEEFARQFRLHSLPAAPTRRPLERPGVSAHARRCEG